VTLGKFGMRLAYLLKRVDRVNQHDRRLQATWSAMAPRIDGVLAVSST